MCNITLRAVGNSGHFCREVCRLATWGAQMSFSRASSRYVDTLHVHVATWLACPSVASVDGWCEKYRIENQLSSIQKHIQSFITHTKAKLKGSARNSFRHSPTCRHWVLLKMCWTSLLRERAKEFYNYKNITREEKGRLTLLTWRSKSDTAVVKGLCLAPAVTLCFVFSWSISVNISLTVHPLCRWFIRQTRDSFLSFRANRASPSGARNRSWRETSQSERQQAPEKQPRL